MDPVLDDSSDMDVSRPRDVVPHAPSDPEPRDRDRFVVATHRKDGLGVVISSDDLITELLGWRADEVVGRRLTDFIHVDDQDAAVGAWLTMLAGRPGERHEMVVRMLCSDDRYELAAISNTNRLDTDGIVESELRVLSGDHAPPERSPLPDAFFSEGLNAHIVTPLLREHERFLHRLTDTLPMGVAQVSSLRRVVHVNSMLSSMLGAREVSTIDQLFADVVDDDRDALTLAIEDVLQRAVDHDLDLRLEIGGEHRHWLVNMRAVSGDFGILSGALLCVADVTVQDRLQRALERAATVDSLTGCFNRASIVDQLEDGLRRGEPTAVMYVDLDHFKEVNDRYGHEAGDRVLLAAVEGLRRSARNEDPLGRLGGDEFLLVCPKVRDRAEVDAIAARMRDPHIRPIEVRDEHGVAVSLVPRVSVGYAYSEDGHRSADQLIAAADRAMYEVKRARRRHVD